MKKRILFYSDSSEYGGHEAMGVQMANAIADEYEVHFLFNNDKIGEQLVDLVRSVRIPIQTTVGAFAFLRNICIREIVNIRSQMKRIDPEISIILQPAIDFCMKGAWASKSLGINTVSYIPMCFSARDLKEPFSGAVLDMFFGLYYRLFDSFITISEVQRAYITDATHGHRDVAVVNNVVDSALLPETVRIPRKGDVLRIGVVGRIAFHQKRHDRLIDIAKRLLVRRADFRIIVIGDGPDRDRLESMVRDEALNNHFEFTGWVERKNIYNLFDILLMVSDYEGVPLAMIEALYSQRMVVGYLTWGTQVYRDYLEPYMMYSDCGEIADKLAEAEGLMATFRQRSASIRAEIINKHSPEKFKESVSAVIEGL